MRLLEGEEQETAKWALEEAVKVGIKSPCVKSHRGVVIVKQGEIIGSGVNAPPNGIACSPEYCGDRCTLKTIHAEMAAIFDVYKSGTDPSGSIMYHARVENSMLVDSREPRCADCSRHILEVGIVEFVLKRKGGYCAYASDEFHNLSLQNDSLFKVAKKAEGSING